VADAAAMTCPACKTDLEPVASANGSYWRCRACGARAATLAFLRQSVASEFLRYVWLMAHDKKGVLRCPCPSCQKLMIEVHTSPHDKTPRLDVCTACQIVWFDPEEYEKLIGTARAKQPPTQAQEAIAIGLVEMMQKESESEVQAQADAEWVGDVIQGLLELFSGWPIRNG
jgi:Zn-finger nucleic acid-binding protein